MEQRDYIKKQLDILGKMLGLLVAELTGSKNNVDFNELSESTKQLFKDELNLDLAKLLGNTNDGLVSYLTKEKAFSSEALEKLAEAFWLLGENSPDDKKKFYFEKCLTLYAYIENTESSYSLERHRKIEQIRKTI